mmetsp:Transcript_90992/g.136303  ORF Transcript_90992/g.136303 Transcript_90992/m.136303 type:complete len:246 (+) Transcript_90992:584-1321(+)
MAKSYLWLCFVGNEPAKLPRSNSTKSSISRAAVIATELSVSNWLISISSSFAVGKGKCVGKNPSSSSSSEVFMGVKPSLDRYMWKLPYPAQRPPYFRLYSAPTHPGGVSVAVLAHISPQNPRVSSGLGGSSPKIPWRTLKLYHDWNQRTGCFMVTINLVSGKKVDKARSESPRFNTPGLLNPLIIDFPFLVFRFPLSWYKAIKEVVSFFSRRWTSLSGINTLSDFPKTSLIRDVVPHFSKPAIAN